MPAAVLALAASLLFGVLADAASAADAQVTEFRLPSVPSSAGSLALGPDGQMWFSAAYVYGDPPLPSSGELVREVDRIAPDGTVSKVVSPQAAEGLTRGPNGNAWFFHGAHVGEIAASGAVTDFPLLTTLFPSTTTSPKGLAAGPDGDLWFTAEHLVANDGGPSTKSEIVARMTPTGELSEFPLVGTELGLGAITAGPDGAVWFVERNANKIGRVTTSGDITEFRLPTAGVHPTGIAAGPDGNVWFTEQRLPPPAAIGRISPDGEITEFPLSLPSAYPGRIVPGPDGRLWFAYGLGTIGTISPQGAVSRIELPRETQVEGIATGQEGDIWYTADGDPPCEGGGGSCLMRIAKEPGVVGRIRPASLSIAIRGSRALLRGRWARFGLACSGGDASDACRGVLRLGLRTRRGVAWVARRRYALGTDARRAIGLRLARRGRLFARGRSRFRAVVIATARGGGMDRRRVLVRRPTSHRRHRSHRHR